MRFLGVKILSLFVLMGLVGNSQTAPDMKATRSWVQPKYTDTAAANAAGAAKAGSSITTTTGGTKFWLRNNANTQWVDLVASFKNDTTLFVAESGMYIRKEGNTVYFSSTGGSGGNAGTYFDGVPSVTHSGTGFIYDYVGPRYYIGGKPHEGFTAQFTLDAADPTYDREDRIVVDSFGHVVILKGVAAVSHFPIAANGLSQLEVTTILVKAGTTAPTDIENTIFYDEGTESDTSSTYANKNFRSTAVAPFSGTYCFAGGLGAPAIMKLTKSFTVAAGNNQAFNFRFRLADLTQPLNTKGLILQLYNGSARVGNIVTVNAFPAVNNYGLKNDTAWMLVSIPFSYFGTDFTFNSFQISSAYSISTAFYLDKILSQGGVIPFTPQKAFVQLQADDGKSIFALNNASKGRIKGGNDIATSVINGEFVIDYTGEGGGGSGGRFGLEDVLQDDGSWREYESINGSGFSETYKQSDFVYNSNWTGITAAPLGEKVVTDLDTGEELFTFDYDGEGYEGQWGAYGGLCEAMHQAFIDNPVGIDFDFDRASSHDQTLVGARFSSNAPRNISIGNLGFGGTTRTFDLTNGYDVESKIVISKDASDYSIVHTITNDDYKKYFGYYGGDEVFGDVIKLGFGYYNDEDKYLGSLFAMDKTSVTLSSSRPSVDSFIVSSFSLSGGNADLKADYRLELNAGDLVTANVSKTIDFGDGEKDYTGTINVEAASVQMNSYNSTDQRTSAISVSAVSDAGGILMGSYYGIFLGDGEGSAYDKTTSVLTDREFLVYNSDTRLMERYIGGFTGVVVASETMTFLNGILISVTP